MAIEKVIEHYFPSFEFSPRRFSWQAVSCPVHGDSHKSASLNIPEDAFNCHGCGFRGDSLRVIQTQEPELTFEEVLKRFESITGEHHQHVQESSGGESRRGVPSQPLAFGGKYT